MSGLTWGTLRGSLRAMAPYGFELQKRRQDASAREISGRTQLATQEHVANPRYRGGAFPEDKSKASLPRLQATEIAEC